jgi:hypothetical protein
MSHLERPGRRAGPVKAPIFHAEKLGLDQMAGRAAD